MEFIDSEAVEEDMCDSVSEEEDLFENEEDINFIDNNDYVSPPPPNPYMDLQPTVCRGLTGAIAQIVGRVKVCSVNIIIISG